MMLEIKFRTLTLISFETIFFVSMVAKYPKNLLRLFHMRLHVLFLMAYEKTRTTRVEKTGKNCSFGRLYAPHSLACFHVSSFDSFFCSCSCSLLSYDLYHPTEMCSALHVVLLVTVSIKWKKYCKWNSTMKTWAKCIDTSLCVYPVDSVNITSSWKHKTTARMQNDALTLCATKHGRGVEYERIKSDESTPFEWLSGRNGMRLHWITKQWWHGGKHKQMDIDA